MKCQNKSCFSQEEKLIRISEGVKFCMLEVAKTFNAVPRLNQKPMSAGVNLKINKLAILPLLTAAALTAAALQLASGPRESQAEAITRIIPFSHAWQISLLFSTIDVGLLTNFPGW